MAACAGRGVCTTTRAPPNQLPPSTRRAHKSNDGRENALQRAAASHCRPPLATPMALNAQKQRARGGGATAAAALGDGTHLSPSGSRRSGRHRLPPTLLGTPPAVRQRRQRHTVSAVFVTHAHNCSRCGGAVHVPGACSRPQRTIMSADRDWAGLACGASCVSLAQCAAARRALRDNTPRTFFPTMVPELSRCCSWLWRCMQSLHAAVQRVQCRDVRLLAVAGRGPRGRGSCVLGGSGI